MTTNKANKVSKTTTAKTAAKPAVKPAAKPAVKTTEESGAEHDRSRQVLPDDPAFEKRSAMPAA